MKGHTPIKRNRYLVSFSKDHHFGLLLVWKIRQGLSNAVSTERISNYLLFFFIEDLQRHFKEEEQLLFCKLSSDDVLRKQAETEHQKIYQLVDAIRQSPAGENLLKQFADILESHIRFEERTFFNHLQNEIQTEELEEISAHSEKRSHDTDNRWKDKFWETNREGFKTL